MTEFRCKLFVVAKPVDGYVEAESSGEAEERLEKEFKKKSNYKTIST